MPLRDNLLNEAVIANASSLIYYLWNEGLQQSHYPGNDWWKQCGNHVTFGCDPIGQLLSNKKTKQISDIIQSSTWKAPAKPSAWSHTTAATLTCNHKGTQFSFAPKRLYASSNIAYTVQYVSHFWRRILLVLERRGSSRWSCPSLQYLDAVRGEEDKFRSSPSSSRSSASIAITDRMYGQTVPTTKDGRNVNGRGVREKTQNRPTAKPESFKNRHIRRGRKMWVTFSDLARHQDAELFNNPLSLRIASAAYVSIIWIERRFVGILSIHGHMMMTQHATASRQCPCNNKSAL